MASQVERTVLRHNPWLELRNIERDEVDFCAVIRRQGRDFDIRVVNLSAYGFMARSEAAFEQGEPLTIHLPFVGEIKAKVAWALGGRVGGQFLAPLEPDRYAELLREASKPRLRWPA